MYSSEITRELNIECGCSLRLSKQISGHWHSCREVWVKSILTAELDFEFFHCKIPSKREQILYCSEINMKWPLLWSLQQMCTLWAPLVVYYDSQLWLSACCVPTLRFETGTDSESSFWRIYTCFHKDYGAAFISDHLDVAWRQQYVLAYGSIWSINMMDICIVLTSHTPTRLTLAGWLHRPSSLCQASS